MKDRVEIIDWFYNQYEEDYRLEKSRHGQLEFLTTMNYIHRYLQEDSKIIEIGAGTGRYSLALAKEGYNVTAIELVEKNVNTMKSHIQEDMKIQAMQGDALDLSRFEDESFDVTLVLGPLYHLYEAKDVHQAIDEALRITKKNGIVMIAFIPVHAIMLSNYFYGNFNDGLEENFTEDYQVKHNVEQLFTGYQIDEFEGLFAAKPIEQITLVSTDFTLEAIEKRLDFKMSDEQFQQFAKFHLAMCERRELLGLTNHVLYIGKKS